MDTLQEILKDVNQDISEIKKHSGNNYFRLFMETAYIKEKRLDLPEGAPPYDPSKIESDVVTKGVMWQFIRKLDVLRNPSLNRLRREVIFIDALQTVTPKEAIVLIHMKDQTLPSIYGNITLPKLKEIGYFS